MAKFLGIAVFFSKFIPDWAIWLHLLTKLRVRIIFGVMTDLVCARSEFKYKMYTMYSIVLDGSYCGAYHAISLIKLLTHLLVSLSFHRMDRQLRHLHFNPWSLYPFFLQSCIYIPPYPFFQTFDRNVGGQHPRYINCRSLQMTPMFMIRLYHLIIIHWDLKSSYISKPICTENIAKATMQPLQKNYLCHCNFKNLFINIRLSSTHFSFTIIHSYFSCLYSM